MDAAQALRIVSALANGANPNTGEVFPPDSPYQSPNIIRALFLAVQALERSSRTADEFGIAQTSPKLGNGLPHDGRQNTPREYKSGSKQGDKQGAKPATAQLNAGKAWSADEDAQLITAFEAGHSLTDIAQRHGRTANGIRARLEKHGKLESTSARWPHESLRASDAATT